MIGLRISVETMDEPKFGRSPWALGQNVRNAQAWLSSAWCVAGGQYGFELTQENWERLSFPPMTVQDFTRQPSYFPGDAPKDGPWIKEVALALFIYRAQLPDTTEWEELSKAQRRKAIAEAISFVSTDRVWQKGRPIETDIPLLLYLIFTIEEIIGCERIPMSRPKKEIAGPLAGKTPPGGPAFTLLRAAYAHTSVMNQVMPSEAETVYSIARVTRTSTFRKQLDALREETNSRNAPIHSLLAKSAYPLIGGKPSSSSAEFVAAHPGECALLFAQAKARRDR